MGSKIVSGNLLKIGKLFKNLHLGQFYNLMNERDQLFHDRGLGQQLWSFQISIVT
jgi:hypothetical protein